MDTLSKFTLPAGLYILTLAFGFWLSQLGKPYNGFVFNVHKLIALAAVIVAVVQLLKTLKAANAMSLLTISLLLAAMCVIALFASGALMSAGQLDQALMLLIHRIGLVLLTIDLGFVAYLLKRLS